MDDKEVIGILTGILGKYPLSEKEKEAVLDSIGILSWTKLSEGQVKRVKKRLENKRRTDI